MALHTAPFVIAGDVRRLPPDFDDRPRDDADDDERYRYEYDHERPDYTNADDGYDYDDPTDGYKPIGHDHASLFVFRVTVDGLSTCPNATVVLTRADDSRKTLFRYAVVYWSKTRPEDWKQRFSGSDSRHGKQLVPIDGLLGSTEYVVRVTALLRDGSNHEVTSSFATPEDCGVAATHTGRNCMSVIAYLLWETRPIVHVATTLPGAVS